MRESGSSKGKRQDTDIFPQNDVAHELTPEAIQERIRRHRMGEIIVQAKPGADVKVEQVRHEFLFGAAIPNEVVEGHENAISASDRKMYLKILGENFNYAVHENALKWYDCEKAPGTVDYAIADRIWEICRDLGIPMRGHCIFWEKDEHCMQWLKDLDNDRLRAAVKRRAIGVTSHFRGRITEFDLNNEMINGEFFQRRLGYGIINEMAYLAKAGNPDVKLFVNDYGILVEGGFNAQTYIAQIENLLANGVPIDGIGCQGHAATGLEAPIDPAHVQRTLNKLARFKLPIKITEGLFEARDKQAQAEEVYRILPVYFAHPSLEAIIIWGFWEGAHWRPWTAMWTRDWKPTPQAEAFRDLVFKQWRTRSEGKADKNGSFSTQAFFGEYNVTAQGKTVKVALKKKDKSVSIKID